MYNWKDVVFFQTQLNVKVNYKPPASAQQHTGGGDAQQVDAEGGKNNFFIHLFMFVNLCDFVHRSMHTNYYTPAPRRGRGVYWFTSVRLSVLPSVQDIFHHIFLSNCWWQKSDIWSQASYRYTILWVAFLDPSDSYFLFAEEREYHKWALAHSSSC
jgi:hypothetical protein